MPTRLRTILALGTAALALAGCGGGGGGEEAPADKERPAVIKNEGDARLLRTAAENYKRDVTSSIAAVRSGLTQGDYDNDLNRDVYDLRVVIYRFDQALRRVTFEPAAEGDANDILSSSSAAIAQLDPIIDAKRWPDDTKARVGRVLDALETMNEDVDALIARLPGS